MTFWIASVAGLAIAYLFGSFFRIMLDEGKGSSDRMRWLVKTHLKEHYRNFSEFIAAPFDKKMLPHVFYVFTGASSLIFAIDPECRTLTGLNPKTKKAIETHADFVAQLLVPRASYALA